MLDVGCGAGFLSNELASDGWKVSGIDLSPDSLRVAIRHAPRDAVPDYRAGSAYELPYANASFDSVLMMDFLEHVDDPARALAEACRVLKPGGIIIFYTFNRTWLSKILAIKAVEWIAKDCPKNFHVWMLFIKPEELRIMFQSLGFCMGGVKGLRPRFLHHSFWSTLIKRKIHPEFEFLLCEDLNLGYLGTAWPDHAGRASASGTRTPPAPVE